MGDVVQRVLVLLHVVGGLHERVEAEAELVLGRRHLVMVDFHGEAHVGADRHHLGAQVVVRVDRLDGEVAALDARTMGHVAALDSAMPLFHGNSFEEML